jgi:hypothetical protein
MILSIVLKQPNVEVAVFGCISTEPVSISSKSERGGK